MIVIDIKTESRYPINKERIRKAITETLAGQNVADNFEVSVLICGERKMKELHEQFIKDDSEDGLHDVLSFPLEGESFPGDDLLRLGDIVVCYPVAQRQANEQKKMVDDEVDFLVSHSCLHLMGIHHE